MDFCVYEQYFAASHPGNGRSRHGARTALLLSTGEGMVRYEATLSFFPHETDADFRISYDIYGFRILYEAKGRRSGKREAGLLEGIQSVFDAIAAELGGEVFWEKPLIDARYG